MQIGALIKAKGVLAPLFQEKLSPRLSYKLMKFISKIETEERFYNETMKEIINTYCEKDEEGNFIPADNGIKIKNGYSEECNKMITELDSLEIEPPNITFTIDELEEVKFSIQDMLVLSPFITEE